MKLSYGFKILIRSANNQTEDIEERNTGASEMEEKFRREEQPLLCDVTVSDEEVCWRAERRGGRAASKMRGAANIMHRWPDDLLSTSKYTCLIVVLAMLFIFMMVYVIMMLLSISSGDPNRFRELIKSPLVRNQITESDKYKVICPVIKNDDGEIFNMSDYIHSLNKLKEKYPKYEYKLLILVNDTVDFAKENNDSAMRLILKHEDILKSKDENNLSEICVETITLSEYMNKSPLNTHWRNINKAIIPLLTQAISIWENRGISFDLNELIKENSFRFENEVNDILNNFVNKKATKKSSNSRDNLDIIKTSDVYVNRNNLEGKKSVFSKKVFKNIRDIIEDLEKFQYNDTTQETLKSEESKILITKTSPIESANSPSPALKELKFKNMSMVTKPYPDLKFSKLNPNSTILPSFLKLWFMFDEFFNMYKGKNKEANSSADREASLRLKNITSANEIRTNNAVNRNNVNELNRDIITSETKPNKQEITNRTQSVIKNLNYNGKFMRMTPTNSPVPPTTPAKSYRNTRSNEDNDFFLLELDINGKLIATRTVCHAFIGEMFKTVKNNPTIDSPAKLIDIALKLFCNTKQNSNCTGIKLLA